MSAYTLYQARRKLVTEPLNRLGTITRDVWASRANPLSTTPPARFMAAWGEVLERATRRYSKPEFSIPGALERTILRTPFCNLVYFDHEEGRKGPNVLIIAPLSGHHATLLRDTVARLAPECNVFLTDWVDARLVPAEKGPFGFDDMVKLLQRFMDLLSPDLHVIAVCQPCPALLAAVALQEQEDREAPRTMTLMAGPIDPRVNITAVGKLAQSRPLAWFKALTINRVPAGEPGFLRKVYPGFLQLAALMAMNPDRHWGSWWRFFVDVATGNEAGAAAHRKFYDDYLAVLDMPAEFYLQTVEKVFQRCDLPRGTLKVHGKLVQPQLITTTALLTVEAAKDDICAPGQTRAAHDLCRGIPRERRDIVVVEDVGHYGVFSGSRWREKVAPIVLDFIRRNA